MGYYRATLPKGMPRPDVQRAMRGYVRVVHCTPEAPFSTLYKMPYEVYYFYSDRDDKAQRVEVDYDEQQRLYWILTDEGCCTFWRIVVDDTCAPGMFDDEQPVGASSDTRFSKEIAENRWLRLR